MVVAVHFIQKTCSDVENLGNYDDTPNEYFRRKSIRRDVAYVDPVENVQPVGNVAPVEATTLSSLEQFNLLSKTTMGVTPAPMVLTTRPPKELERQTIPVQQKSEEVVVEHLTTTDDMSMETLTGASYLALMEKEKQPDPSSQSWTAWNNRLQNIRLGYEKWLDIRHVQNIPAVKRVCYAMGVTYMNSMQDIRRYFKIRYLYYNTLEYEVGYMTQQIIWKYQVVLELFHTVQAKFVWFRNFAPTTYMFYMYINILQQCRHIIHLCNMMHEMERKYTNANQTLFDDYHLEILAKEAAKAASMKPSKYENSEEERMVKQKRRERYQRKKERIDMEKKGIYTTTPRTKTPRISGRWDLHYGWSIETW